MWSRGDKYAPVSQLEDGESDMAYFDDLVDEGPSRPHRRLFIGIGAVLVVSAIVIACVILLTREGPVVEARAGPSVTRPLPLTNGSVITLNEVLTMRYTADSFAGEWISDDENIDDSDEGLFIFNVKTKVRTILIPRAQWSKLASHRRSLSDSRQYVLCPHSAKQIYRYTRLSLYDIYDVKNNRVIPLTLGPDAPRRRLQYATWVPGRDSIVFVFENNIYIRPLITSPEVVKVTSTGINNVVYNGIPDWVYEEEVIGEDNTIWFSEDGKMMAYASFNDTNVDIMPLQLYGEAGKLEYQYPITIPLRYPKPGRDNPTVAVYIVDLDRAIAKKPAVKLVPPPAEFSAKEHYLTRAAWADNASLALTWMNRHQNHTIMTLFTAATSQMSTILDQPSPDNAWCDIEEVPIWSKDGSSFITLLPKLEGSAGHYKHIHTVWRNGLARVPITSGRMTVTEILHWDQDNNLIYFKAAPEEEASQRHLYTVTDIKAATSGIITCITCNATAPGGQPCAKNSFDFSTGGSHYVWTCQGPSTVPRVSLRHTENHQELMLIADNKALSRDLAGKVLPQEMRLMLDVADGFKARVRMKLPPGLKEDSSRKYPMLVYTYGGPNSQVIGDGWGVAWDDHLVTERDIIYVTIDGRGSGYRGDRLLHSIYYKMGMVEVEDQIAVAKKLTALYDFIDANRTAIWGWSYGGYVTARVMATDTQQVFKCGISVAPVTNWIYYDTIYTERYMGLPTADDNARGYAAGDVSGTVDNFRNKQYLLIHGTADDNVHYQQSMMLSRSLEQADIMFRQQTYPDENHGLGGIRRHHYHTMERFLEDCFRLPRLPFSPPPAFPGRRRRA
ncbi:venom dipeptidyl peptidase 4-like isoform X1 [Amphibalanus amphitrite]|uniref:venom dipeptidyl peptidase 4-like isoform X1 n=1 Tax=Amphibalanus amphitrite TaxID=1232801 RepID=UPI001C904916|nr:venom dipeptidyl peptidase 4-like isoform X1 [Amphibalanus amphitrite]